MLYFYFIRWKTIQRFAKKIHEVNREQRMLTSETEVQKSAFTVKLKVQWEKDFHRTKLNFVSSLRKVLQICGCFKKFKNGKL